MNKTQKQLCERAKSILHAGFTPTTELQTFPKALIIKHDFAVSHTDLVFLVKEFHTTLMKDGRLCIEDYGEEPKQFDDSGIQRSYK